MKKFDLTTNEGVGKALKFVGNGVMIMNPVWALGKMLIERVFTTPEDEGKMVSSLIEKGKKEGVDEMEITVKSKGGIHLDAPIEGTEVKFMAGRDGETRIKVKYK